MWNLAFWMDILVLGWVMIELTDSPFKVALVGTFRVLPLGVLGPIAGSQGDRRSKKEILLIAQFMNISATIGLAVILGLDVIQEWHVFLVALITGSAWAIDFPVRRAFVRDILPEGDIVNAFALDAASLEGTGMVGRWLAGGLLSLGGAVLAYSALPLFYLVGALFLLRVTSRQPYRDDSRPVTSFFKDLKDGLSYAWRHQGIRGVLIITAVANFLLFPYIPLTPVFARDVFDVGPGILGLMSGMDSLGALISAITLASILSIRRRGIVFLVGTTISATGATLFSLSWSYVVAIPMLFLSGLGLAGFTTMQRAIPVTLADPTMRGRALGATAMAVGLWPMGLLYVGMMAEWFGAPIAVASSCIASIVIVWLVALTHPDMRRA